MQTIYLHGELGDKFGYEYKWEVRDAAHAIRALCYRLPGFRQAFSEGAYQILRNDQVIDLDLLHLKGVRSLHLIPVPQGAKSGGLGKILIGTLIVAAAFALAVPTGGFSTVGVSAALGQTAIAGVSFGAIATFGGLVALSGIAQLVSPSPRVNDYSGREKADQRGSFLINSKVNTIEEGLAIPVIMGGPLRVGVAYLATGISSEASLPTGANTTTEGWVTDTLLSRWIADPTPGIPPFAAEAADFTNPNNEITLPDNYEDVVFYGYHNQHVFGPSSLGGFLTTTRVAGGLWYGHPNAGNLPDIGLPFSETTSAFGVLTTAQQQDAGFRAFVELAGGSAKAGEHPILSALEYTDDAGDEFFQLILGGDPPDDYFDTIYVQDTDNPRAVLHGPLASSSATVYPITQAAVTLTTWKAKAWRWSIGTTAVANLAAGASNEYVQFWLKVVKTPTVIITHTVPVDTANCGWEDTGNTYDIAAVSGRAAGILEQPGDATEGPFGYTDTDYSFPNSVPIRENDHIIWCGYVVPNPATFGNWAVIIDTPGRAQDWLLSVEFRSPNNVSNIKTLLMANATVFDNTYPLRDGGTGTAWIFENEAPTASGGDLVPYIPNNVKLIVRYEDVGD